MSYLTSHDIHARIGANGWPQILSSLGIGESFLRKRPGPCPACGGNDRFTFDNRKGHGDYFCRKCEPGDGFKLLMRVHGWDFPVARRRVMEAAGISEREVREEIRRIEREEPEKVIARPTRRVEILVRECCRIEDCEPAVVYLKSRALWPLPKGHRLRAHPSVAYFQDRVIIGRYPALVAVVRDVAGEFVSAHVTYLTLEGRKLQQYDPRKILSPLTNREGCAVRLMEASEELGIAEGIETAFSAARMDRRPVWAAINAPLLAKFEPPVGVKRLAIYADRDEAGLEAAAKLMERLQGRVACSLRVPPQGDWNDVLRKRAA
jgi:putative DNA primase/helicase